MKRLTLVTAGFVSIATAGLLVLNIPAKNTNSPIKVAHKNIQDSSFQSKKRKFPHKLDKLPGKTGAILPEYNVGIDFADEEGDYKDLLGVNKSPLLTRKTGKPVDLREGYKKIGISEVRMHDDDLDVCKIYQDDEAILEGTSTDYGDSCFIKKDSYHLTWKAKNPREISNIANYDFTSVDQKVEYINDIGAKLYLRLGESWNGPNDVASGHEEGFTKVAGNIFRHYLGHFGSSLVRPEISAIEVHNEADGRFWEGSHKNYYKLMKKTLEVLQSSGFSTIGAGGFTTGVNHGFSTRGELLFDFIREVGASNLDFFSAHYYGGCTKANFAGFISWITDLQDNLVSKGFLDKPIHITEWNIGAGNKCRKELDDEIVSTIVFSQPHMFSYTTGMMILMQEVENLTHAHFYAGGGIEMSLFVSPKTGSGINLSKAFMSFYIHNQLKGSKLISTSIEGITGDYSYKDNFIAKGFKKGAGHKVVLVNDGNKKIKTHLDLDGLGIRSLSPTAIKYSSLPASSSKISLSCSSSICELNMDEVDDYIKESREITPLHLTYTGTSTDFDIEVEPYSVMVINL